MPNLREPEVASAISIYLQNRGLSAIGKHKPFGHADDEDERSFEIDFAFGPICHLGERTIQQEEDDKLMFEVAGLEIDPIIDDLRHYSIFPGDRDSCKNWQRGSNPNPVYGIAIEIENDHSKYLLGSMLAAAITGRWGILILPDSPLVARWISTLDRMMHKGATSPIPTNITIFTWRTLEKIIKNG